VGVRAIFLSFLSLTLSLLEIRSGADSDENENKNEGGRRRAERVAWRSPLRGGEDGARKSKRKKREKDFGGWRARRPFGDTLCRWRAFLKTASVLVLSVLIRENVR
jgi:hypothetical protein